MHQFIVEEKDVNNLVSKTYICKKKYCKIDITEQRNTASVNNKDQPCKKIHFIDHL